MAALKQFKLQQSSQHETVEKITYTQTFASASFASVFFLAFPSCPNFSQLNFSFGAVVSGAQFAFCRVGRSRPMQRDNTQTAVTSKRTLFFRSLSLARIHASLFCFRLALFRYSFSSLLHFLVRAPRLLYNNTLHIVRCTYLIICVIFGLLGPYACMHNTFLKLAANSSFAPLFLLCTQIMSISGPAPALMHKYNLCTQRRI